MGDWFLYEGEDLVFKVEYDSEGSSGDGWNEPRNEAHAWIHKLWYATKPVFTKKEWVRDAEFKIVGSRIVQTTGGSGWVEMDPDALSPALREAIEDECNSYAFPESEDA